MFFGRQFLTAVYLHNVRFVYLLLCSLRGFSVVLVYFIFGILKFLILANQIEFHTCVMCICVIKAIIHFR